MELFKKEKWIIDTDPGCDDLFAILYLLKRHDAEVMLVSIAHGNVKLEDVEKNTKRIYVMNETTKQCPYTLRGINEITENPKYADDYHFEGGLGNIKEINELDITSIVFDKTLSPVKIVELVKKYPNEINLLSIAPCTNISVAFMLDPSISKLFKSIFWMGGSLQSRGNVYPMTEFNFGFDPIAAQIMLKNFEKVVLVPWEPTEVISLSLVDLEKLKEEIISEKKNFNQNIYFYIHKIVEKFMLRGQEQLEICDLYAIIAAFNHQVVVSFFIGEMSAIIDSNSAKGAMKVEKIYKHDFKDFTDAFNNLSKLPKGSKIVVDQLDRNIILNELKLIFIK